ncbi:hypothetical protein J11TS1_39260 [Oceanobacillus sp. J11TS1]|nr:hypothetical protein J11TS1_39260 [Oceanobacillus sp. J11TS1]
MLTLFILVAIHELDKNYKYGIHGLYIYYTVAIHRGLKVISIKSNRHSLFNHFRNESDIGFSYALSLKIEKKDL